MGSNSHGAQNDESGGNGDSMVNDLSVLDEGWQDPEMAQLAAEIVDEIAKNATLHQLDLVKSKYFGKQGLVTAKLRELGKLPPAERSAYGARINQLKQRMFVLFAEHEQRIKEQEVQASLQNERIDVTLPARRTLRGHLHPISQIRRKLEDFFVCMGFAVVDGPELEDEFHNFTALNMPSHHSARSMHDTFYLKSINNQSSGDQLGSDRLAGSLLASKQAAVTASVAQDNPQEQQAQYGKFALRSQTSSVQVRTLEAAELPLRIVCPGRVFRRDNDATHSPMFHQMELLMVDRTASFAQLRWLIFKFVEYVFGANVECRFRPSYFPFTEPSAEVDIKWRGADGKMRWLELGGCGMVHPNVLQQLNISSDEYRGFAFGFGLDRLAMVYYGINDIRHLYENDVEFLAQF